MPSTKPVLLVRVTPQLHKRVRLAAARRGVSMARIVTEALTLYLRRPQ